MGCAPDAMSAKVRQRLDVYRAIALRDGARMHSLAAEILDKEKVEGFAWARFLLSTAMLGAHASGRADEVSRLWSKHGNALYQGGVIPPEVVYVVNWKG